MTLKLCTGTKKGISLASTKEARELRPTQALVRQALVNTMHNLVDLASTDMLDLYAGIGTVGLEFLSSGARSVIFIEKDTNCLKVLRENIKKLGFIENSRIIAKPLPKGLSGLEGTKYGLIFADPPYGDKNSSMIIKEILAKGLLADGGYLIWETAAKSKDKTALAEDSGLTLVKQKSYGDTVLHIMQS